MDFITLWETFLLTSLRLAPERPFIDDKLTYCISLAHRDYKYSYPVVHKICVHVWCPSSEETEARGFHSKEMTSLRFPPPQASNSILSANSGSTWIFVPLS